jgi:hypothetical protein
LTAFDEFEEALVTFVADAIQSGVVSRRSVGNTESFVVVIPAETDRTDSTEKAPGLRIGDATSERPTQFFQRQMYLHYKSSFLAL